MIVNQFSGRVFVIALLITFSFFYSFIIKVKFNSYLEEGAGPIVATFPMFEFDEIATDAKMNTEFFTKSVTNSKGSLVHVWGTWCAPCEAEFPELLNLLRSMNGEVNVLLLAINDKKPDIKKFLNRFGELPPGVIVGLDNSNKAADLLGTQKVPETFLFDQNGRFLHKYIGPQEWQQQRYFDELKGYFNITTIR